MKYRLLLVMICALGIGCVACTDSGPEDPVQITIARVEGANYSLADFQRYLQANLSALEGEKSVKVPESDRVQSRLLDGFIEEELLLREARRQKIEVTAEEIDAYLSGEIENEEQAVTSARRLLAERRLQLVKLELGVAESLPEVADEEARSFLEKQHEATNPSGRRVRFRSIRFELEEDAKSAHRAIRRGRNTIDEILVFYALPPDQGIPVEMAWETLPEELKTALDGLKRGRISDPQELNGGIYLFQVESWIQGVGPIGPERLAAAKDELERERRREAYDQLLKSLRETAEMTVKIENLPFQYIADT